MRQRLCDLRETLTWQMCVHHGGWPVLTISKYGVTLNCVATFAPTSICLRTHVYLYDIWPVMPWGAEKYCRHAQKLSNIGLRYGEGIWRNPCNSNPIKGCVYDCIKRLPHIHRDVWHRKNIFPTTRESGNKNRVIYLYIKRCRISFEVHVSSLMHHVMREDC
jgi:hypothetical protein